MSEPVLCILVVEMKTCISSVSMLNVTFSCVEIHVNKTRHPAADYDMYDKTGQGDGGSGVSGQAAKANYQGWQTYQAPHCRSSADGRGQCQPLQKETNVSERGYYCLFLADLQSDKKHNFPFCSPLTSGARV